VKIGIALTELHRLETNLADEFRKVGERHAVDHGVFYTAHVCADQCDEHARRLHQVAPRYQVDLPDGEGEEPWQGFLESVRRGMSTAIGRAKPSSLLLLRDLRQLFLAAEECSITWVMLGQAAQAARDRELLQLVTECHDETEMQVKWLTTQIKVKSPQVLLG
jgi:hypothetical protein